MQGLFIILFLLSICALIVGLFKPSLVIRWGEVKNRKRVLFFYGVSVFVFMMLTGTTASKSPEQKQAKNVVTQQVKEETGIKTNKSIDKNNQDSKPQIVCDFIGDWTVFVQNEKYGYIDRNNNIVLPAIYDMAWPEYNGVMAVIQNGKFKYRTKDGKEATGMALSNLNDKAGNYIGVVYKHFYEKNEKVATLLQQGYLGTLDDSINQSKVQGAAFDAVSRQQEVKKNSYSSPSSPFRY